MQNKIVSLDERTRSKGYKNPSPIYKLINAFGQLSKTEQETLLLLVDAFLIRKPPETNTPN